MGDKPWGKCIIMTKNFIVICYAENGISDDKPPVGKFVTFEYSGEGKSKVEVDEVGGRG